MSQSQASLLASLPEEQRQEILDEYSEAQLKELLWDWRFWGRPEQIAPDGDWSTWVALAGRGFGKTEAGAQWVQERVNNGARSIALVAETQKDLEEVMVARLIKIAPPGQEPTVRYKPVRISWPSGAVAYGYVGTEPNQLRGPEFDTAWVDEFAKYRYAREAWDMLQFTMRSGNDPRVFITTTPRPIPILKEILSEGETVVTTGSTFDNAGNLAPTFLKKIRARYEGTRLGRQELNAEILDDLPGALWVRDNFDIYRKDAAPMMSRIVVAVDPSGTRGEEDDGDSVGIVVVGKGVDGRGYVLADRTCNEGPAGWAKVVTDAYKEFQADRVVAERNFGGAMVEHTIRTADPLVAYKEVTASRGKVVRAEPIAALYEQGRVSHIGSFPELEDQMCDFGPEGYIGDGSPDRADALVWALTDLNWGGDMVFDVPYDALTETPFAIPAHWAKAFAVERRGASLSALWGAVDPSTNDIHLYAEAVIEGKSLTMQAASIKARGDWVPGLFPGDTPGRTVKEARGAIRELKAVGLQVKTIKVDTEAAIGVANEIVNTGQIKVFSTLQNFEREYRTYMRGEDGKPSETGPLMTCFQTWVTAGRKAAIIKPMAVSRTAQRTADARAGY